MVKKFLVTFIFVLSLSTSGLAQVSYPPTTIDYGSGADVCFATTVSPPLTGSVSGGACSLEVNSSVAQVGQTIECTEFNTSMLCDATHGIDFNTGSSKAPVDMPRDTQANCASVTSVGRVCMYTNFPGGCIGDGSACREFVMLAGAQTISGAKTFSSGLTFNSNLIGADVGLQSILKGSGILGLGGSLGNTAGVGIYSNANLVGVLSGGAAQSTSTTAVTFGAFALATGNAYDVTAHVLARCNSGTSCTGGGRGYSITIRSLYYNTGGTLTKVGSDQVVSAALDDITGAQTVAFSSGATDCGISTAICLKVQTDTTNQTINWIATYRYERVS